jgi:hypothetical protein
LRRADFGRRGYYREFFENTEAKNKQQRISLFRDGQEE